MSQNNTHGYDMVLVFNDLGMTEAFAHTILELPIFNDVIDLPAGLGNEIPFFWQATKLPDL